MKKAESCTVAYCSNWWCLLLNQVVSKPNTVKSVEKTAPSGFPGPWLTPLGKGFIESFTEKFVITMFFNIVYLPLSLL